MKKIFLFVILILVLLTHFELHAQTYIASQSSQYNSPNCPGTYANMTDGSLTTGPGCNGGPNEWIKADFGSAQTVTAVTVAGGNLGAPCNWGPIASYLNSGSVVIQSSTNNSTWTTQATVSGTSDAGTTTFSFASVTAQYWRLYAPTGWLATSEFTFTFGSSAMVYSSSTTTQTNTSTVTKATTNNEIIGIQIVTSGTTSPLSATSFSLNTTGTTAPLTDITNAKLWYTGTSSTFAATTPFGTTVAAPNGAFTITGTQTLSSGTNYFWLTYDVPAGATTGNLIDAECTSLTVGSAFTPTVTAPAGSRTIDGPMTYISSTATQSNTSSTMVGFSNQEIIGIQIVTAGSITPLSATSFSLNTTGTTNPAADITNAKLWYTGTTSTFATTTQFGTTVAAPNGAFTITSTQTLSAGINYFWLTYDITSGATINNVVDAQCTSITVGSAQTPAVTAPTGSRTISKLSVGLMAAGGNQSLAVCSDGTARSWGWDTKGQLGDDAALLEKYAPVPVSGSTGITAVAGGYEHSLALKNDGTISAWGNNANGQLGNNTTVNASTAVGVDLTALGTRTVTAIAAGDWHSIALCSDGTVWAWGYNGTGQLGDGSVTDRLTPVQVSGLTGITAIAGGRQHTLALKNDNTVWAWGWNSYDGGGMLGDNTNVNKSTPVQVRGVGNAGFLTGITAIGSGDWTSLAVKSDGTAYAWGSNSNGQRGDGITESPNTTLTPVQMLGITNAAAVAGGNGHSLVLKTDGTVWSSGYNTSGQLGDNTTTDKSTPVQVRGPGNVGFLTGITAIAGSRGQFHSISLKNDGTVWSWGYNIWGQMAVGAAGAPKTTPVQAGGLCSVGPLPVELLSFSAHCTENNDVRLEWATASETNNDYFTIERSLAPSPSGEGWGEVGTVKGAGNSSTIRNYEFVDESPFLPLSKGDGGIVYYRLKQTDYDGKHEFFGPISVQCQTSDEWNLVLQNIPAQDELLATLMMLEDAQVQIDICDLQGRKIISYQLSAGKGSNLLKVDLKNVQSGIYFIKVTSPSVRHSDGLSQSGGRQGGAAKQFTKKFVKQ